MQGVRCDWKKLKLCEGIKEGYMWMVEKEKVKNDGGLRVGLRIYCE